MYSMTFNEAAFVFLILMLTNHNELTHNPPPKKKMKQTKQTIQANEILFIVELDGVSEMVWYP